MLLEKALHKEALLLIDSRVLMPLGASDVAGNGWQGRR